MKGGWNQICESSWFVPLLASHESWWMRFTLLPLAQTQQVVTFLLEMVVYPSKAKSKALISHYQVTWFQHFYTTATSMLSIYGTRWIVIYQTCKQDLYQKDQLEAVPLPLKTHLLVPASYCSLWFSSRYHLHQQFHWNPNTLNCKLLAPKNQSMFWTTCMI